MTTSSSARYFSDAGDVRWRVYDLLFGPPAGGPGQRKGFDPPDPATCQYRLFKNADGTERLYAWQRGERRDDLDEATLARQLRQAEYVGKERFKSAERKAR